MSADQGAPHEQRALREPAREQWGAYAPRGDCGVFEVCLELAGRLAAGVRGTILPATAQVYVTPQGVPFDPSDPPGGYVGVKLYTTRTPPRDGTQPLGALLDVLKRQAEAIEAELRA